MPTVIRNDSEMVEPVRVMEYGRSMIEGVEIKLCRNNHHAYKPHVHRELSLGYIVEGSTELSLQDTTIKYKEGDGVVIPPLVTHRCAPHDSNHWAYTMLFVDPAYYQQVVSFSQTKKLTDKQVTKLKGFIDQLVLEEIPDMKESILISLLWEFGDAHQVEEDNKATEDSVITIHEYLINHLRDHITLGDLEKIAGLNKFSLIRNFKKRYVTTPAAYLLQCRVAEAKRLLQKGADVFTICEELHFYDQAHFIREFKRMYGITPGSYINQLKG